MTINEWKGQFEALHKAMKEDLGANFLEVIIDEEIYDSCPCGNPITTTNIKIIAK